GCPRAGRTLSTNNGDQRSSSPPNAARKSQRHTAAVRDGSRHHRALGEVGHDPALHLWVGGWRLFVLAALLGALQALGLRLALQHTPASPVRLEVHVQHLHRALSANRPTSYHRCLETSRPAFLAAFRADQRARTFFKARNIDGATAREAPP